QISMTGAAPGDGEGEADQGTAIESANNLAPDLLAHHEHAQRNQVNIVKIPDLFLQRDAGIQLIHAVTLANGDLFRAGDSCTHFWVPSSVFACCHKASISSSVACSRVRPCRRNSSSSQPKRRRNFLLVLRNADSGSTDR